MEDKAKKVMEIMTTSQEQLVQDYDQRLERLNKYVAKVEQAEAEMIQAINDGKFESFSEDDIKNHLTHDPDMIAAAGLFLAKVRRARDYAINDTKTIRAKLRKECNQKKEILGLSSASDRDDWVQTNPEYQKAVKQELEWRYRVEQMEVVCARYENLFTGSRKIASMLTKEMYDHGI